MTAIKDYFIIGNLHTCALVSNKASIDWMCLPSFDSPSIFAQLLDKKGGSFSIFSEGYSVKASYVKDTAILQTLFKKRNEQFIVRDFMVPSPSNICKNHLLVRNVTCNSVHASIQMVFNPLPHYARHTAHFKQHNNSLVARIHGGLLLLHFPKTAKISRANGFYDLTIDLKKGQRAQFILEFASDASCMPQKRNVELITSKFWKEWVSKGKYFDFCRDNLVRSAITVKLMQYYPTGAIIAAPTTSLPEEIGGMRNWDYRYCWIRDSTFALYSLYVLGYTEEAKKFFAFIEEIVKRCKDKDIDAKLFYTIEGQEVPKESTLEHLDGYKHSRPVRIGNAARSQFQLDVYGSLIDAYYFMTKRDLEISAEGKRIILAFADRIARKWRKKDYSLWEIRSRPQHYTHSKVMAWVGINRALELCKMLDLPHDKEVQYRQLEAQIKQWIWKRCFDKRMMSFAQHTKAHHQDATNILFVLLMFLDKRSALTQTIISNTCKELLSKDVFVYRYHSDDKLKGNEGAFLLCSFWLVSAYAITEDVKTASKLFYALEKKLDSSGLIAEEMDTRTGEYLGNFPQLFSQLGYIMSAYYLHKYSKRREISLNKMKK